VASNLIGGREKWGRGWKHCEAFTAEAAKLGIGGRPHFYPTTAQVHREGLEYRFHIGKIPVFDGTDFALIAGDCLFDARAALDYLVFQLHLRRFKGRVPPGIEGRTAFPILTVPPPQRARRGKRTSDTRTWQEIRCLNFRQRRASQVLQPYNGRNDKFFYVRDQLATLARLNNIDKHRHLHVVRTVVTSVAKPSFAHEYGFRLTPSWVPLESHAEVFRWTFTSIPPNLAEQMNMNSDVTAEISLYEGGSYTTLAPLLEGVLNAVGTVLSRFEVFARAH